MRMLSLLRKTAIENLRDWKILVLTLFFASFFVVLYYFSFSGPSSTLDIVIVNEDEGVPPFFAGRTIADNLSKLFDDDASQKVRFSDEDDLDEATGMLKDGSADLVILIPDNYTRSILATMNASDGPIQIRTIGNPSNPDMDMATVICQGALREMTKGMIGEPEEVTIESETIKGVKNPSSFERAVPGLLALSFMMLMFTTCATIIREKDKGTLVRLKMADMRLSEFAIAISATQLVVGMLALSITYLTAIVFGYPLPVSLPLFLLVGVLSCTGIIAISLIVAAFLRSIFDLMTIGCIPFFVLMFFSGGMFPLPAVKFANIMGRDVNFNDLLPTTHSIYAMDKVLTYNGGISDVGFELFALSVLTVLLMVVGIVLLRIRFLRTQS
jgi:ABC-2 type transport system permease protein